VCNASHPFKTVYSPLNYTSNPRVNGVSHRGLAHLPCTETAGADDAGLPPVTPKLWRISSRAILQALPVRYAIHVQGVFLQGGVSIIVCTLPSL
jgi:hypothetical protein